MIFSRSSRLGIRQLQEPIEQVPRVVRPRACLGVVLDGAAGHVSQRKPFDRAVVEIEMGELGDAEVGFPGDRLVALDPFAAIGRAHGETVVLRGDVDLAGLRGP